MSGAPRLQPNWDWRAAGNFVGGGSGTGILVAVAALVPASAASTRLAIVVALALIAIGLALVWLEIGRPWRFLNVYRQPARSWMTREAYAALPVFAFGLLALGFPDPIMTGAAAIFALVFLYCQARILQAAKGIPAWRVPFFLPLVIATGLTEGAGFFVLLTVLDGSKSAAAPILLAALLVARIAFGSAYHRQLAHSGAPTATMAVLDRWKSSFLLLGEILPLAALCAGWLVPSMMGGASALAAVCAIAAGWSLKFVIVTRAAYTQGFALLHTPARGPVGSGGPRARPGWH